MRFTNEFNIREGSKFRCIKENEVWIWKVGDEIKITNIKESDLRLICIITITKGNTKFWNNEKFAQIEVNSIGNAKYFKQINNNAEVFKKLNLRI